MARLGRAGAFRPILLRAPLWALEGGDAPGTTNVVLTDDISLGAEDLVRDFYGDRGLADTETLSESLSRDLIGTRGLADTESVTEDLLRDFFGDRGPTDTETLTESISGAGQELTRGLSDTLTVSEDLVRGLIFTRDLSESFSLTEDLDAALEEPPSTTTATLSDILLTEDFYFTTSDILARSLADSITLGSDTISSSARSSMYWTPDNYAGTQWRRMEDYVLADGSNRIDSDFAPVLTSWGHWQVSASTASTIQLNSEASISGSVLLELLP